MELEGNIAEQAEVKIALEKRIGILETDHDSINREIKYLRVELADARRYKVGVEDKIRDLKDKATRYEKEVDRLERERGNFEKADAQVQTDFIERAGPLGSTINSQNDNASIKGEEKS